ncbi:MAG TPA: alpha/beta fold hydrolase [Candidatus Acidoferrales bacterium]|nr:alpha/beta fold hydrolase [Candidatus Acidoferrales bacterium]
MLFALFRSATLAVLSATLVVAQAPATPQRPVTDIYHSVKVTDNYRWLEKDADPEVKAWSAAQNRYARAFLDAQPMRAVLQDQLAKLYGSSSSSYSALRYRSGVLFALKSQPPKEQPLLVWMRSATDPAAEKVVLDPNQIDAKGGTEIDFFEPSHDGKLVAVSLSRGGSESGDVHVYDASNGKALADVIPRVNNGTAGGSVAWKQGDKGFYYTRYPRAGERPAADLDFYQQVWFHTLGTPVSTDTYSLGKDFPRIAEILLSTSGDGRYILAQMANGDGGEFAHYLLSPDGRWTQVTRLADSVTQAAFGGNDSLWLVSRQGSPMGKILRMPLSNPSLASAPTVITESKSAVQEIIATPHRLYVVDQAGGPMQVRVFDEKGTPKGVIPIAPSSSVGRVVGLESDDVLVLSQTYLQPPAWSRFDAATGSLQPTALRKAAAADYSDTEVLRQFAVSKDGTSVPLNIIRRKGTKLDGNNPVVLYAYGGYGISLPPFYDIGLRPLLDRGVIYVIANLRGGGEYGEDWHRAGMLTKKQNVFDDFAACAKWLIDQRYTNPKRLAIEGGSNGGLLMGAALTQHPELFAAVVAHVGIYDMLRVELSPNGAFNVTEFGTVKEADQFKALFAYSPYHHVVDGVQYPAVMFLTGANDPRVEPANSRKMTARLQASGSRQPVYLRTTDSAGHGIGTALSERIAQAADVDAFLFTMLRVR